MAILFLVFEETSILASMMAVLIHIPTTSFLPLCSPGGFFFFFLIKAFLLGRGDFPLWDYSHFLLTSDAVYFLKYFWPLEHLFGEMSLQVICNWGFKILVSHPRADICQFSFYHSSGNFPGSWHFLFPQKKWSCLGFSTLCGWILYDEMPMAFEFSGALRL